MCASSVDGVRGARISRLFVHSGGGCRREFALASRLSARSKRLPVLELQAELSHKNSERHPYARRICVLIPRDAAKERPAADGDETNDARAVVL